VALGAAAAAGVLFGVRVTGYPPLPFFQGSVLSAWEAHVVRAAASAMLPPGPAIDAVPERVDRYLVGMPPAMLREVHAMLALIEHGTTPLAGRLHRFTNLSPADREVFLSGLDARGGLLAQAYRGLRDLCLLGYYQQPSTWDEMGYNGPRVPLSYDPRGPDRMAWPAYDAMVANPEGDISLPKSMVR
jgi:D-cysteine desulfhydrase